MPVASHRSDLVRRMAKERQESSAMTPDPKRKPTKDEMRAGGMVATAVLIFLAIFTLAFIWMA